MQRERPDLVEHKLEVVDPPRRTLPKDIDPDLRDLAERTLEAKEKTREMNKRLREVWKGTRQFRPARRMDLFGMPVDANFNFKNDRLQSVVYLTSVADSRKVCGEAVDKIVGGLTAKYGAASKDASDEFGRTVRWEMPTHWIGVSVMPDGTGCRCGVTFMDPAARKEQKLAPAPF